MIKILKGDDATHDVNIELPEVAFCEGAKIEFEISGLIQTMPSKPKVTIFFPISWTKNQPLGRVFGTWRLIGSDGQTATITNTYPVYVTNDATAVSSFGSVSGTVIPTVDLSDISELAADATPGDIKATLNELMRRLKKVCIVVATIFSTFFTVAATAQKAPLDTIPGTASVVTNVTFEGLVTTGEVAAIVGGKRDVTDLNVYKAKEGELTLRDDCVPVYYDGKTFGRESIYFVFHDGDPETGEQYYEMWIRGYDECVAYFTPELVFEWYGVLGDHVAFSMVRDVDPGVWPVLVRAATDELEPSGDTLATASAVEALRKQIPTDAVTASVVTNITRSVMGEVTATIPETVTNVVRDVQGLVYDEKLGITWKQTMYNGNLYYVAVTNANITEVK